MTDEPIEQQLLAEQQRTNKLLERLVDSQPKPRLCDEGRRWTCRTPFFCRLAGCQSPGWQT